MEQKADQVDSGKKPEIDKSNPLWFMHTDDYDPYDLFAFAPDPTKHPDFEAFRNLTNEGTPEEIAEEWKDRGNRAFARGGKKDYLNPQNREFLDGYHDAALCYTKALELKIDKPEFNSTCLSNRAACNLVVGNYRRVLEDCTEALRLNPRNVKAAWRAGKALLETNKLDEAVAMFDRALELEPDNKTIRADQQRALQKIKETKEAEEGRRRQAAAHRSEQQAHMSGVLAALTARGVKMGRRLQSMQEVYERHEGTIRVDDRGELHLPVLFVYEEHSQSDFVQDFSENQTFQDHLSYMFPDDSPAPWDAEHKYVLKDLEIYVQTGAVKPLQPGDGPTPKSKWLKVRQTTPLSKLLTHPDYVLPHWPIVYVVVANSKFRTELLKRPVECE